MAAINQDGDLIDITPIEFPKIQLDDLRPDEGSDDANG
jgi:hypothetical protein